jgi:hypothetical protein
MAKRFSDQTESVAFAAIGAIPAVGGVRRAHVRGSPSAYEGGDKRTDGEAKRCGSDGRGIGGSHAEHQRVDGGGGADAEGAREQRRRCEAGAATQGSGGEAEIVERIAEPAGEPDISDFLSHPREAKLDGYAASGHSFGNAGGSEVRDAAVEAMLASLETVDINAPIDWDGTVFAFALFTWEFV